MASKEKVIQSLEKNMKKYKNKVTSIDSLLKDYKAHNKEHLMEEREDLKEKLKEAEAIFKKLKSSSQENFEEIKASTTEAFTNLKEALHDFSNLLTIDQLYHARDEVVEYGSEKVTQVENYIKQKPLSSAAWAFGIGFLIGAFIKRSK